jgi:ankyrin repeat protein
MPPGHDEPPVAVRLLIAKGAVVNAENVLEQTPLDQADAKETADILREHGAKTGEELKAVGK